MRLMTDCMRFGFRLLVRSQAWSSLLRAVCPALTSMKSQRHLLAECTPRDFGRSVDTENAKSDATAM